MAKRDLVEAVGVAGVIAGLIFVGAEIRQSSIATRAATTQQVKDAWLELNLTMASTPELSTAFALAQSEGLEALDPGSQLMVISFFRSLFHNWSNGYSQFLIGTLEEPQWTPHFRDAAVAAEDPVALSVWRDWNHVYDDDFRVLFDSLIAAAR